MPCACYHHISTAHQPEKGGALALQSRFEMLSPLRPPSSGSTLDGVHRRLH